MAASPHVSKHVWGRARNLVLSLVLWLVIAWIAVGFGQDRVTELTHSFTEVTATATEETTISQVTGTRRTKRVEQVPGLVMEYQYQGEQLTTDVVADGREVGDSMRLWVDDETREVQTAAPEVKVSDWLFFVGLALVVLVWAFFMVRGIIRAVRLATLDPASADDRFQVTVQRIVPKQVGKQAAVRAFCVVTASNAQAAPLITGSEVVLESQGSAPPVEQFPARLEGAVALPGRLTGTPVMVRGIGTADWWMATANAPTQQDRPANQAS